MANKLVLGSDATPTQRRHGALGTVQLGTAVPPALKDALIHLASEKGRTLRAELLVALEGHVRRHARMLGRYPQ